MRASFALLALAAIVSAGSIHRRQLPACAMQCMATAQTGGCDPTDNTCMCKNADFVNSTYECVQSTCTDPDELKAAIEGARALCAAAGVSLTETVPAATDPAPTATESAPEETSAAATSPAASASMPAGSSSAPASATGPASSASRTPAASSRPAGASSSAAASPSASSAPNGAVGPAGVSGMVGVFAAVAGIVFAL
ncbi:hypothetical protein FRC08_001173 [Ceratobasidium sp. 394]|nr:hypothetical protein FRC08_001173 [Ceratobasidium sp. 394]KAG9096619.1 hypothetical protein FS749_008097 [Ceratobasidium sp. UAMH 11750]